nr:Coatomer beta subunit [Ipomoea batatas]
MRFHQRGRHKGEAKAVEEDLLRVGRLTVQRYWIALQAASSNLSAANCESATLPPSLSDHVLVYSSRLIGALRMLRLSPPSSPAALKGVLARACSDGESDVSAITQEPASPDVDTTGDSMSTIGDGYVALFVRMLGLDNDPLDRREAIEALWKYSLGGKKCVDTIMQFPGSVNLTVNLLKSESDSAREAAAGLLRVVSSV